MKKIKSFNEFYYFADESKDRSCKNCDCTKCSSNNCKDCEVCRLETKNDRIKSEESDIPNESNAFKRRNTTES